MFSVARLVRSATLHFGCMTQSSVHGASCPANRRPLDAEAHELGAVGPGLGEDVDILLMR